MTTLLPVELLHQIFDDLALKPELIWASLVCRSWRVAVFLHPTYFKHVIVLSRSIDSITSDQLALAAAQLSRAPSDAYNVTLDIRAEGFSCSLASSADVGRFCRKVVRNRLLRVRTLRICYSDLVLQEMMHALQTSGGAPALEELILSPGFIHVSQYHILERRKGQIRTVIPQEARQLHWRGTSQGGWLSRFMSKCRQNITAYSIAWESQDQSVPAVALRDGMARRPGYNVMVALPESLSTLAPILRTLKLQHMELSDQESLQFDSVQVLSLQRCRGFPLARLVKAFPNLRSLWSVDGGSRIEQSTNFLQFPETLQWLSQLDSLHIDDLKVVQELIVHPGSSLLRPSVCHLTMLDVPNATGYIDDFVSLAPHWHKLCSLGGSAGPLHLKLEPLDLEPGQHTTSLQHSVARLSFHHPQSNTSFGLRLKLNGESLIEYHTRAYVYCTKFHVQPLIDRLTTLVLPETHIQYGLQGMGHLPRLGTVEVLLSEGGRFNNVRASSWQAVDVPPPRTLRLRRPFEEGTSRKTKIIQVAGRDLLRAVNYTFHVSNLQFVVELEDGVQLRHDATISSIGFKELAAICSEHAV